jgi:hypothetical protein
MGGTNIARSPAIIERTSDSEICRYYSNIKLKVKIVFPARPSWYKVVTVRSPTRNKFWVYASSLTLLLSLLLLAAAKHAADVASSTLDALGGLAGDGLAAVGDARAGAVHGAGAGDSAGDVAAFVVLALALSAVDALLGGHVADGLEEAALTDLAGDEVVDAVLEVVDLIDAGDLGLVEVLLGSVAGLVILGEPSQVHVLEPRHPLVVRLGVVLLAVLHCKGNC